VGGADEAVSPERYDGLAEATTGAPASFVARNAIGGNAVGNTIVSRATGQPLGINIAKDLSPSATSRVYSHELGHAVDQIAGEISTSGLSKELRVIFNAGNNPSAYNSAKAMGREHFGYKPGDTDRELMAEAIRAYITNPNYLKSVAPTVAARIRQFANSHPKLSRIIQFNSLAAGAIGASTIAGQPEPNGA
jgi:hypothetical protein